MGISRHRKRFADPARDPRRRERPQTPEHSPRRRKAPRKASRGSLDAANDSQTPPKRKKREPGFSPGSRLNGISSKHYSAS